MENLVLEKPLQTLVPDLEIKPEQQKSNLWIEKEVLVIILLNKNFEFKGTKGAYDILISGKKMWEWVALCADGCTIKTAPCTDESDVLTLVKPFLLDNYKYTAVLYSDTPLLSRGTFVEIMQYVRMRDLNVLKLERGYVFNTEYIKNAESISLNTPTKFGKNDFFVVSDNAKLTLVREVIKTRIIDYHVENGVMIENPAHTTIDADVIIESGVKIAQGNAIYGSTYIGKGCVLEPNNIIKDSVVSDNCNLLCSYIEESRISENITVGPFESVIKKSN